MSVEGEASVRGKCQRGEKKLSEEEHTALSTFNSNLTHPLRITFL